MNDLSMADYYLDRYDGDAVYVVKKIYPELLEDPDVRAVITQAETAQAWLRDKLLKGSPDVQK